MTSGKTFHRAAIMTAALLLATGLIASGCARSADAFTPQQLQQQYGITDAYTGQVQTLQNNVTRQQLAASSPSVVEQRAEPAHARHRSWEKELVIIGGSAGAGAGVGALTGGKKGAGIGAAAGGAGGLIYDLLTRNK